MVLAAPREPGLPRGVEDGGTAPRQQNTGGPGAWEPGRGPWGGWAGSVGPEEVSALPRPPHLDLSW